VNNVVLIGFMGSGKSTVGPILAQRLGRPFRDLDDEIVAAAGRPVDAIFKDEGEVGFRRREAGCLARALAEAAWTEPSGPKTGFAHTSSHRSSPSRSKPGAVCWKVSVLSIRSCWRGSKSRRAPTTLTGSSPRPGRAATKA